MERFPREPSFTALLRRGPTRGRTIGDETRLNDPVKTMKVAVGVDVPRFLNEFMTRISGLAAKAQ